MPKLFPYMRLHSKVVIGRLSHTFLFTNYEKDSLKKVRFRV